jgi:flagellar hook assembly protein FlgD
MVVSGLATSAAGNGTEISYTLSSDAEVEVTVLNIAGRLVRTLVNSAAQPAGAQRVVWNGASNAGVRAPSGMYLIVVRARAEDGQEAQAIGPLTVGP